MTQANRSKKPKRTGIRLYHVLTVIIATVIFISMVVPMIKLYITDNTTEMHDPNQLVPLENGTVFKQEIGRYPRRQLQAINLRFNTYGRKNRGTLKVTLYQDDSEIASWTRSTADLVNDELESFELEEPIRLNKGKMYSFTVTETFRGRNMVALWMDAGSGRGLYINDDYRPGGEFCFTLQFAVKDAGALIVTAYIVMLLLIVLFFLLFEHREKIYALEAALAQKCKPRIRLKSTEVTIWDWIIFALLAGFCYFAMSHGDILHTGGCSFALLKGHILDFYEYNTKYLGGCAYMISTYLMFALWNIPLVMLGLAGNSSMTQPYGVLMWFKGLPTTLFVLSGILFYKICKKYEKQSGINAKWGTFLFLLTPTAFYSQFMFGQYDVMTVFFMVLALKVLLDEKRHNFVWFSVIFGFATTFKYHALLFYVPILLYKEKRLPALIKNAFFFLLPIVLVNFPYLKSSFFTSGVENFGAVDYFFASGVEYYLGGTWKLYLVPLFWVAISTYAYVRPTDKDGFEALGVMAYLTGLVAWLAFGVVFWHPQWVMIATPFLILGLVVSKRRNITCLIDLALTIAFISFVESLFVGMTQGFYSLGFFGDLVANRQTLSPINLGMFCPLKDNNIAFTTFSCLLLARALLIRPEWNTNEMTCRPELDALWFRIRGFVGVCIIVIPMIMCFIGEIGAPTFTCSIKTDEANGVVNVEVQSEAEFQDLSAAVWSEEDGQDDLKWYVMEHEDEGLWKCTVNLADHNALGTYFVHLYEYPQRMPKMVKGETFKINSLEGAAATPEG
ncbi:MAG: GBS Bsp-like repeat-containing protein [Clostridia bacterium]|nr:GBS Bsp-like repeat-containing protein [Clostridia bacterium]